MDTKIVALRQAITPAADLVVCSELLVLERSLDRTAVPRSAEFGLAAAVENACRRPSPAPGETDG